MSNTNLKKLRLLLALALASAPLIGAPAKKHKGGARSAATSKAKDAYKDKSQPTGLNHDETIMQNFKHIPGESRLIFYNPENNVTRAIGTDGTTQYHLNKGQWEEQAFPAEMSGYFAVSTSGKALSSSQIDALLKAGDLAGLADHAMAAQMAAKGSGVTAATTLTEAELAALEALRKAAIARGNIYIAGLTADVDGKLVKNEGITPQNLKGKSWTEVSAKTGLYELPGGVKRIEINGLGHAWGINTANDVVFKASLEDKDEWEQVNDVRSRVSVNNKDHVWSIGTDGGIYVRTGISPIDPDGAGWSHLDGWATEVAINDNNMVYVVGGYGIYFRVGVTDANPAGTHWIQISNVHEGEGAGSSAGYPVGFKGLSINNQNQLWAVGDKTGMAYVLAGVSEANPAGTHWISIPGKCKQVVAVSNGAWCIDDQDKVFFREGVTAAKPDGTGWAGPFPHDLNYIFASGSPLSEPKLAPMHSAIKEKQINHRIVKMQHRLDTLKEKETKAQGADKTKLAKTITGLEARIAKLSQHEDVKPAHKNMGATKTKKGAARATATPTKGEKSKKPKKARGKKTDKKKHKKAVPAA